MVSPHASGGSLNGSRDFRRLAVSRSAQTAVVDYIHRQPQHHRTRSFDQELKILLKNMGSASRTDPIVLRTGLVSFFFPGLRRRCATPVLGYCQSPFGLCSSVLACGPHSVFQFGSSAVSQFGSHSHACPTVTAFSFRVAYRDIIEPRSGPNTGRLPSFLLFENSLSPLNNRFCGQCVASKELPNRSNRYLLLAPLFQQIEQTIHPLGLEGRRPRRPRVGRIRNFWGWRSRAHRLEFTCVLAVTACVQRTG